MAQQKAKMLTLSQEEREKMEKEQQAEEEKNKKKNRRNAFKFFCENTVSIEFVRDEQISRAFFPLLPFCKLLPKESKIDFHNSIDYNNHKGKLRSLMEQSDFMINVMQHEEQLNEIFRRNFLLALLASNKNLWETLASYTNSFLNIVIIVSYSQNFMPEGLEKDDSTYESVLTQQRLYEPRLFFDNANTWTGEMILTLGLINLSFSSVVLFFFFVKKAPLLLHDLWVEWFELDQGLLNRLIMLVVTILKSVHVCLMDFDFVYYLGYMTLLVVGLLIHPFFFGLLTLDFLRTQFLRNVVEAIWRPRNILALTFLVFLLIEYYFALISYIWLYEQYMEGGCSSLWKCFLNTYDYTFKATGSIGGILIDPKMGGPSGAIPEPL